MRALDSRMHTHHFPEYGHSQNSWNVTSETTTATSGTEAARHGSSNARRRKKLCSSSCSCPVWPMRPTWVYEQREYLRWRERRSLAIWHRSSTTVPMASTTNVSRSSPDAPKVTFNMWHGGQILFAYSGRAPPNTCRGGGFRIGRSSRRATRHESDRGRAHFQHIPIL